MIFKDLTRICRNWDRLGVRVIQVAAVWGHRGDRLFNS